MPSANIQLSEARFEELARVAEAQGKTPDQLADEAVAILLSRRRLENLIDFGQQQARDLGIREADVDQLISEVRSERRRIR